MRRIRLCMYLVDLLYLVSLVLTFYSGFRYGVMDVDSGAMLPYLHEGDRLYYGEQDTVSIGDVVVYSVSKDLVCRRVVQEIKDGYITKADAVPTNDSILMYKDSYVGTVIRVVRNGVAVDSFLHSPWLLLILLALTVVIWAA